MAQVRDEEEEEGDLGNSQATYPCTVLESTLGRMTPLPHLSNLEGLTGVHKRDIDVLEYRCFRSRRPESILTRSQVMTHEEARDRFDRTVNAWLARAKFSAKAASKVASALSISGVDGLLNQPWLIPASSDSPDDHRGDIFTGLLRLNQVSGIRLLTGKVKPHSVNAPLARKAASVARRLAHRDPDPRKRVKIQDACRFFCQVFDCGSSSVSKEVVPVLASLFAEGKCDREDPLPSVTDDHKSQMLVVRMCQELHQGSLPKCVLTVFERLFGSNHNAGPSFEGGTICSVNQSVGSDVLAAMASRAVDAIHEHVRSNAFDAKIVERRLRALWRIVEMKGDDFPMSSSIVHQWPPKPWSGRDIFNKTHQRFLGLLLDAGVWDVLVHDDDDDGW